jgi:hypothetical protein
MSVRRFFQLSDVIVLVSAALTWLVATIAVAEATHWPVLAILPLTLVFALVVGAVNYAVARRPKRNLASLLGRGAVAAILGVVVGEIAAVVLFAGSIDQRIDQQAAQAADSTPAVALASTNFDRVGAARTALDNSVDEARIHRDQALVVARCEYNPTPACPQTHITGVPGTGPETRTADELLADTQRELDNAIATRDRLAPGLDAEIGSAENAVVQARQAAISSADRGLGARWVAMHGHTLSDAAAMVLWALTIAFFEVLNLLALLLNLIRGETTSEHSEAAGAVRERAEVDADTAISVKRAEVRATIETMWAEQQLVSARLAIEAQNEIDREVHRRRVEDVLDKPVHATLHRASEPALEADVYLPIAAEAEAASRAASEPKNLPARVEADDHAVEQNSSLIPNVTSTAARWIRPFVPPFVARAIDTTTHPLRTARQVFEEVEEITFSLKRTHKVTVTSEESVESTDQRGSFTTEPWEEAHQATAFRSAGEPSVGLGAPQRHVELDDSERPTELRRGSRRELPPSE